MFLLDFCSGSRELGFPLQRVQLDISSTVHRWDLANISWHSGAASPNRSEVESIFGVKRQHSFAVSSATSRLSFPRVTSSGDHGESPNFPAYGKISLEMLDSFVATEASWFFPLLTALWLMMTSRADNMSKSFHLVIKTMMNAFT